MASPLFVLANDMPPVRWERSACARVGVVRLVVAVRFAAMLAAICAAMFERFRSLGLTASTAGAAVLPCFLFFSFTWHPCAASTMNFSTAHSDMGTGGARELLVHVPHEQSSLGTTSVRRLPYPTGIQRTCRRMGLVGRHSVVHRLSSVRTQYSGSLQPVDSAGAADAPACLGLLLHHSYNITRSKF